MTLEFDTFKTACRYRNEKYNRCCHGRNFSGSCAENNCPFKSVSSWFETRHRSCEYFDESGVCSYNSKTCRIDTCEFVKFLTEK